MPDAGPPAAGIVLRPAEPADAAVIAALLGTLGYECTAVEVEQRRTACPDDPVIVAEQGGVIRGVVALHVAQFLHKPERVARITALVVAEGMRSGGIGAKLVAEAARVAAQAGCGTLELTSATLREAAHRFYRRLGFEATSYRFSRPLTP